MALLITITILHTLTPYISTMLAMAKVMTALIGILYGIAAVIWACRRRR